MVRIELIGTLMACRIKKFIEKEARLKFCKMWLIHYIKKI